MSTNLPATRSDGFDTYTESVDGHEDRAANGGGVFLNFGLDAQWHRSTDKAVVTGTALVLMSLERRCVRRVMVDGKQRNEETQVISSGPWPDTDAWNAQLPAAEKVSDFNGNPTGPWFKEATLRFVDPDTLTKYTWTARLSTAGAAMCPRYQGQGAVHAAVPPRRNGGGRIVDDADAHQVRRASPAAP
jgi:hypothetical protein